MCFKVLSTAFKLRTTLGIFLVLGVPLYAASLDKVQTPAAPLPQLETAEDYRLQAQELKTLHQMNEALAVYEMAAQRFPRAEIFIEWADYLLALNLWDEAAQVLDRAAALFSDSPDITLRRAVLASSRGLDEEAVTFIRVSWKKGAKPMDWLDRPWFSRMGAQAPYNALLSEDALLEFSTLDEARQVRNMQLLSGVLTLDYSHDLASGLLAIDSPAVRRAGLSALGSLGASAADSFAYMLKNGDSRLRRQVLQEIRVLNLSDFLPVLSAYLPSERAPGNHDFAQVVKAQLAIIGLVEVEAIVVLQQISKNNTYRFLALGQMAGLYEAIGMNGEADALRSETLALRPIVTLSFDEESELERYWECMEREDLNEMKDLLQYHEFIGKIDARVYGLPQNDFDDHRMLSIAERLFLRDKFTRDGNPLPREGQTMYPREIRHWLRRFYKETGMVPDCSGILTPLEALDIRAVAEDGGELKLHEDSGSDNEVNIVVNPYDQRYIVSTSNDYSGAAGNDEYYSSDWGKTWTFSDVPGPGACDPVSYYNQTGGQDVLYHSYLTGNSVDMKYSLDNGVTWATCTDPYPNYGDRQDHVIDTDPQSGCFNTIYISWQSGETRVTSSNDSTFPHCNSWRSPTVSSTGGSTIGAALIVSPMFGSPGANGIAHDLFTGYGAGNLYEFRSSNCGVSWTQSTVYALNNGGDFEWPIPSTCTRQIYFYPQGDSDRQVLSDYRNNMYVTWNDLSSNCTPPGCNGNTTCNNDIFFGVAVPDDRDNPTDWTWQPKINLTAPGGPIPADAYTDEFYPSLTVDQASGDIYVSFYRTGSGNTSLTERTEVVHYYIAKSIDGGSTWELHRVTDLPTNEANSGANLAMQWGDYTWNDVINGVSYPNWTDRRESADEDIWSSKVCSEPTHWSERSPTWIPPVTTAVSGASFEIDVSWASPDIFWGDGGENDALRKYQLWVDGALEVDNILWTDTATSWTAADCTTPHSFVIRAINQCGISKDYTAATGVTAVGCCADNPDTVDVTPNGSLSVCEGPGQLLTASLTGGTGPFVYQWTRDGGDIGGATGSTYTANDTGVHTYNCNVRSTSCVDLVFDVSDLSISWDPAPTAVIVKLGPTTFCEGGSVNLQAGDLGSTGLWPYSYLWAPGGETTQTISVTASGSYSVTITDSNTCMIQTTTDTVVAVNPNPTPAITPTLNCPADTSTLDAGVYVSYLWAPGGETTQTITVANDSTMYTVTVTDANGCSGNDSNTVPASGGCISAPSEPSDVQGTSEAPMLVIDDAGNFDTEEQLDADTYNVYEGDFGIWASYSGSACWQAGAISLGRASLNMAMASGSHWYLISASNSAGESRAGVDSAGVDHAGTCGANP